jgi:hypothetical protein
MLLGDKKKIDAMVHNVLDQVERTVAVEQARANADALRTVLGQPKYKNLDTDVETLFGFSNFSSAIGSGTMYSVRAAPGSTFRKEMAAAGFTEVKNGATWNPSRIRISLKLTTALTTTDKKWKDVQPAVFTMAAALAGAKTYEVAEKAIDDFCFALA